MKQKILIFDSSTLINFSMNGMTEVLKELKRDFNGKFIITNAVKREIIERPLTIKKFKLAALKLKELYNENILEPPSAIGINGGEIKKESEKILNYANSSFKARDNFLHIIDLGEASCLALSLIAGKKSIENIVAVDERTTRMLGEKPENLEKLFEKKFHTKVIKKQNFNFLKNIVFLRSSELVYVAWKKGMLDLKSPEVLDALLYAVKYKGCAISSQEIEAIKKLKFS